MNAVADLFKSCCRNSAELFRRTSDEVWSQMCDRGVNPPFSSTTPAPSSPPFPSSFPSLFSHPLYFHTLLLPSPFFPLPLPAASAVSSPSGVWGRAPTTKAFWYVLWLEKLNREMASCGNEFGFLRQPIHGSKTLQKLDFEQTGAQ